jgi:hypothetical protein
MYPGQLPYVQHFHLLRDTIKMHRGVTKCIAAEQCIVKTACVCVFVCVRACVCVCVKCCCPCLQIG